MKTIFEESFLVDTNILVYALDEQSVYYRATRQFLHRCIEEEIRFFVAQQNILELVAALVRDYHIKFDQAVIQVRTGFLEENLVQVISPMPTTIDTFLNLSVTTQRLDIYDVFLAATCLDNNVQTIVTNNSKDFMDIPSLRVVGLKEVSKIT